MTATTSHRCLGSVDVLVLAGGLGTRLKDAIGDRPKLLAPIAGRPYASYLFDWLCHFGAKRIVLSLGYRGEAVVEYLKHQSISGLEVVPVLEPRPLGTAGAIRFVRDRLHTDPVLVLNGDSYTDADLCALLIRHRDTAALGTVLCTEIDDAARYGRVTIDRSGCIAAFFEKDTGFAGPAAINAGVYLFSAQFLDTIAAGDAFSLEQDVLRTLPPGSLAAMVGRHRFIDIGTPESLAQAAEFFAEDSPNTDFEVIG